ncbi:MAG: hypothetical protein R2771_14415 [Saprospiraceae bacterium]
MALFLILYNIEFIVYKMRSKYLLLFLLLFSFSISLISQDDIWGKEVTLRINNKSLPTALVVLSKESGVNIAFNEGQIPSKLINLYSPGYTFKEILDYLLEKTELTYEVIDNQVVILPKSSENKIQFHIKGYIKDANTGEKLINANIYLSDFSKGTVSNEYGYFLWTCPKVSIIFIFHTRIL